MELRRRTNQEEGHGFLFLSTISTISHGASVPPKQVHGLPPPPGAGGFLDWRLAVETNNIRNWDLIPRSCRRYVAWYMLDQQYSVDCDVDILAYIYVVISRTL
ncbi:acid phosphatase 1-like [Forsythia ovata]|uniref:Acid phosphatase 1-like n=1 Tax=Forsythia ovata TaxID=205694 RepID=A0ABD1PFC1_9LAMI